MEKAAQVQRNLQTESNNLSIKASRSVQTGSSSPELIFLSSCSLGTFKQEIPGTESRTVWMSSYRPLLGSQAKKGGGLGQAEVRQGLEAGLVYKGEGV